jgi:hypothetical protein
MEINDYPPTPFLYSNDEEITEIHGLLKDCDEPKDLPRRPFFLIGTSKRYKRKQFLVNIKGGRCERCGYNKSLAALEFHHLDPETKASDICQAIGTCTKKEFKDVIVPEVMEFCTLLCANCHRETHDDEDKLFMAESDEEE